MPLTDLITSTDPLIRHEALERAVAGMSLAQLEAEAGALDTLRREATNLYERVRACFFLYALHRFCLPPKLGAVSQTAGLIPAAAHHHLLERRFGEAIEVLLETVRQQGLSDALSSALAHAYHRLALQNLADQVRSSVRLVRGNQWMFRCGSSDELPLRVRPVLTRLTDGAYPLLHERTAVRMDLTHSSWSDIFFLGMDFPEGARVLNISVDLAVQGRDQAPRPPLEAFLRVIDRPVLRLASVDLGASAELTDLDEVFDFAKDYLGLLKAALIASGLVPMGLEGSGQRLDHVLETLLGPGLGLELVSSVNGIPKGSRLAVSTNLLGSLISVCMRATGQTNALTGPLDEPSRRIVAARAILGEWLGGSGGGWQDSGGVWPGIKVIEGAAATPDDPEFGISRGRLLPRHTLIGSDVVGPAQRQALEESLVLVHGGMAQNVGPILEMVTEKYLLRSGAEWVARRESLALFDPILEALKRGDVKALGALTTQHFFGPLQTIIPWATTYFTERVIDDVQAAFADDFWGFWMLGGMSGGGMGFMFAPERKAEASHRLAGILMSHKQQLEHSLPFAMDPVVYDFAINEQGTAAALATGRDALMPPAYYAMVLPSLLRTDPRTLPASRRRELEAFRAHARATPAYQSTLSGLVDTLLPAGRTAMAGREDELDALLSENGFDSLAHDRIRLDLQAGHIGLARNRLPASTRIANVREGDVFAAEHAITPAHREAGAAALRAGEVAVVTLAAGAASRWTGGAGVVKALHPFCKFHGRHRTFLEVHLAKTRRTARDHGAAPFHIITTSYLTHRPIWARLESADYHGLRDSVRLSRGRSIGLRLVPMLRDLRFLWEENAQQRLDERQEKVRTSLRAALLAWARDTGEGTDYRDNQPLQCLHPVGHWYEIPNLLLNGTLASLLRQRPALRTLLLHNIDTLGACADPGLLGWHRSTGATLGFEVIPRRLEDRGGGLARVNDQLRLIEGLALPREEDEFLLTHYNTLTCWIEIDPLLAAFGLDRAALADTTRVAAAVRDFSRRLPTYITLKEVKKRWGHGQEDVFPVAQFERLWGDMSALPEIACAYAAVPRTRGAQLKEQAQLDGWLRDGTRDAIDALCLWD
ncbi:MAG: UTP--glucose-1-phosphate uridylyltransferase [Verrucomicrobiales bacterium]